MSGSRQRIGVLIDGSSRHREASRQSGEAIAAALGDAGHEARPVFVDRDLDLALRQGRFDVAFLALRGPQGSDGSVQGLLELLGIPYTGAGVLASALAMNQAKTREVLRLSNLPTAPGYVIPAASPRSVLDQHGGFGFPVAVGPADAGLTHGTALARDEAELEAAVEQSFRLGNEVLVERYYDGDVVAVAVLDGEALGGWNLGGRAGGLGIKAGHARQSRVRSGPASHPALLRIAEQSTAALGVEGPALVEMVVGDRCNEIVRGVDVAPLLAPSSLYARIAVAAGLRFGELVELVLAGARLRTRARWLDEAAPPAQVGLSLSLARGACALPH
jgi:D-alanine-D-alanine ligase